MDTSTASSLQEREQIIALEHTEDERLRAVVAEVADEKQRSEHAWTEKIAADEAKAKAEADAAVREYAQTELRQRQEAGESRAKTQADTAATEARKRVPKVVDMLLEQITHLSF